MSYEMTPVSVTDLIEDPENARLHDEKNKAAIKASLNEFGQVEPLVVRKATNVVIGGNGRLTCMKELGWEHANVILLDIDAERAKALGLALNRTAELAEWDYKQLSSILRTFEETGSLGDLAIGWQDYELSPLLQANWSPTVIQGDLSEFNDDPPKEGTHTLKLSDSEWEMFQHAAEAVRELAGDIPDGLALKIICEAMLENQDLEDSEA